MGRGTLCSEARFRLRIRALREHAFVHGEYPVIVTLENHVTKYESQKKMARILKEELGEMLFVWKAGDVVAPNRLLKKVVIRDKPKKPKEDPEEADLAAATESAATPADVLAVLDADPEPGEDDVEAEGEVEHKLLEHQTSSELSELIYIRNTKTKTLPSVTSEALTGHEQFVPSSSWSETKLKKMLNQDDGQGHAGMIFWCQSKLARIYPAALRVESTNYDPSEAWAHGCQVVALNVQEKPEDEALWLNAGKFLARGYVLKPAFMMGAEAGIVSYATQMASQTLATHATLKVGLGEAGPFTTNLARIRDHMIPDVYCEVTIGGGPQQDRQSQKTAAVRNHNPSFGEYEFTFDLAVPELAVVVITLRDRIFGDAIKDHLLGVVSVPVPDVIKGKRLEVPLMGAGMRLLKGDKGGPSPTVTLRFELEVVGGGELSDGAFF